jgi:hypothetical protein
MICSNDGCENEFEKTTHNQKYCSDECCRVATNAKIKEKNQEKRDRLNGKKRVCKNRGCNTILSMFNEESTCAGCDASQRARDLKDLMGIINGTI